MDGAEPSGSIELVLAGRTLDRGATLRADGIDGGAAQMLRSRERAAEGALG
jgi:hypothetical protein